MRLLSAICLLSLLSVSRFGFAQAQETIKIYGLDLGSHKSIYHQLGISQASFYLADGNVKENLLEHSDNPRRPEQIACKQSGFGIKKALSDAYHQQTSKDEYLSGRKENLNKRIIDDLNKTEVSLISQTSKKFAQPECSWAFNSVEYAGKPEPTLVSRFKSKSGINKLTQLDMSFNHQGQLLAVSAEQIVERLDVERLDAILAAIAKRYGVELDAVSSFNKTQQQRLLEGKSTIDFETKGKSCQFSAKNTFYRSDAVAEAFGIDQAHAYIKLQCKQTSGLSYHEKKLQEFVTENVNKTMSELLAKHKTLMKTEGQKEKNSGFVF